jgi:ABC-2 type transport system ATP-binding protein
MGITIVVSTPYLDEAERCARVALLHEGRLLALDTTDALRATLPGRIVEVISADQARAASVAARVSGVEDVQTFGERMHVRFTEGAPAGRAERVTAALSAAGIASRAAREVPPSLEDVFIARLTGPGHERTAAQ